MKTILLFLLLAVLADDVNRIAAINRLRKEAETAFQNENYQEAVHKYSMLVDSLGHRDEKLMLNYSNACFKANDTTQAKYLYNQLTGTDDPSIKSIAYQQLGIMANNQQKYQESLYFFKNSLKADPQNEDSRYNYELLKKMMQNQQQDQQNQENQENQENKEQQQDQQQQDQEQSDEESEDQQNQQEQEQQDQQKQQDEQESQQDQEQENDENQESENQPEPQKMEDMKISEEMAKKILEAMRNNEIQYLQQQRRKPTKPQDSGKPDW